MTEFERLKAQKTEMEQRARERQMNPLKLIISGAERQVSEGLRVGAGQGKEYFLAAQRALTTALKIMEAGVEERKSGLDDGVYGDP